MLQRVLRVFVFVQPFLRNWPGNLAPIDLLGRKTPLPIDFEIDSKYLSETSDGIYSFKARFTGTSMSYVSFRLVQYFRSY